MKISSLLVAAQAEVSEQDVVTPFEEILLVIMVFVIMFGLGAGLTPRDFRQALRSGTCICSETKVIVIAL